jgi:hypothetical protein
MSLVHAENVYSNHQFKCQAVILTEPHILLLVNAISLFDIMLHFSGQFDLIAVIP